MDRLSLLEAEVDAMSAVLRDCALDAPVAACPGWDVRMVGSHLTGVHRWVIAALDDAGPPPYAEPLLEDPASSYALAAEEMLAKLRSLPAQAPAWTFDRHDQTAGFWRRRQLHEVAVHRWDAQPYVVSREVAEDGIDEVLDFMLPRQIGSRRTTVPEGTLRLVSLEREWAFGAGRPVHTTQGTASDLYLGLWGRVPLDLGAWGTTKITP